MIECRYGMELVDAFSDNAIAGIMSKLYGCEYSLAGLSDKTGIVPELVMEYLRKLENLGLASRDVRGGKEYWIINRKMNRLVGNFLRNTGRRRDGVGLAPN